MSEYLLDLAYNYMRKEPEITLEEAMEHLINKATKEKEDKEEE